MNEIKEELSKNEERIVNITYSDGSSCDVLLKKMIQPIPKDEYVKLSESEAMAYSIEVPVQRAEYYIDDEHKVICLQDQKIKMRDGVAIYADIYLPISALDAPVPLLIGWSFNGKQSWHQGVQNESFLSEVCNFGLADPMYWCYQGYGVAYVDPRGVGNSEGDQLQFGSQNGKDGYDFIEWAAQQKWCNKKVALFGDKDAAINGWQIAAECPPHLMCMAPCNIAYEEYDMSKIQGKGYVDDVLAMIKKEPFMTSPYWQDKIPKYENIKIPVYMNCNWMQRQLKKFWEAFEKISSTEKWIYCHQNCSSIYEPRILKNLKLFFDRYLKNIHNGWELTSKVQIDVMDAFDNSYQTRRNETKWPLDETNYKKLYLNATTGKLGDVSVKNEGTISYDETTGFTTFEYTFRKDTLLTGYLKCCLWIEVKGNDDANITTLVKKLSSKGDELPIASIENQKKLDIWGMLRVSKRHLDEEKSKDYQPVYTYDREEKLKDGEIVAVDIAINPLSRLWHKGQKLQLVISGKCILDEFLEPLDNKGELVIHTGGKYDSYLLVPEIPSKYEDGDCIYR